MFKKILAALLCTSVIFCCAVTASAEDVLLIAPNPMASADIEWDGSTDMQKGKDYVVTGNVTISTKEIIPTGASLTVEEGGSLTVSAKGGLYINGTFIVETGGKMNVSGVLYQYKNKSLTNKGTINFTSTATGKINGRFTNVGTLSGKPKVITAGEDAYVVNSGKNSVSNIIYYVYRTAVERKLETVVSSVMKQGDIYGAVKSAVSTQCFKDIDASLTESMGMSLEDFCAQFGALYLEEMKKNGIEVGKVKSVDVKAYTMKVVKTPDDNMKQTLAKYYGGSKVVYNAECTVTVKTADKTFTENAVIPVVMYRDKWYIL
ncbi:MAG: hypothetical protein IJO91_02510 [Oscillospiraceae bacterium]|nr:hypothetical protein [Oscillospiraceae bacterium]